jgi:alkyl sulfatase BDS1-like metallo-beta-lactamase superfamily hydrolase
MARAKKRRRPALPAVAALMVAGLLWVVFDRTTPRPVREQAPAVASVGNRTPELVEHGKEFRREVVKVTDGVWVAVGYGLANSILIEGDDGLIVVDTLESIESARTVRAEFAKISTKPIKAIIYTHFHPDHTYGAGVFAEGGSPEVIAQATTNDLINSYHFELAPSIYARSSRQFGTYLPDEMQVNAGIGPFLAFRADRNTSAYLRPTRVVAEHERLVIAGVGLEIFHAPGETEDQLLIWLPDKRVALPGDTIYRAFPNLYAIRGTAYRDLLKWVASLDKLRALNAAYLVPSHTRPLSGEAEIRETVTAYRDAIQYVHDQTVRWMNKGLTPSEIAAKVKLPPHLRAHPFLREWYGTVAWSVRAIFAGKLGWFDGNPAELFQLEPNALAARLAAMSKAGKPLGEQADAAIANGDWLWAAVLADATWRAEPDVAAHATRLGFVYRALAGQQTSANGRNYYLTTALEIEQKVALPPIDPKRLPLAMLHSTPIETFMRLMPTRLNAEKSADMVRTIVFRFPDVKQDFTLYLRRGVVEVTSGVGDHSDATVVCDSTVWKEIVTDHRGLVAAVVKGDVEVQGAMTSLATFLLAFGD